MIITKRRGNIWVYLISLKRKIHSRRRRDWSNSFGDSIMGIANGKNYYCNIPEQSVEWRQSIAKGFDPVQHIRERYGVDVSGI